MLFPRIILTALALLVTVSLFAQRGPKKDRGGERERVGQALQLTDQQKKHMKALRAEFQEAMQTLRQDESLSHEQKKEKRFLLRQEMDAELQQLFTDEQWATYSKHRAGKQADRKERREHHQVRAKHLREDLDLTETQAAELKVLRQKYAADRRKVAQNASLTQEQKKAAMKAIRVQHHAELKEVLSDEQFDKLEKARQKTRPNRHNDSGQQDRRGRGRH